MKRKEDSQLVPTVCEMNFPAFKGQRHETVLKLHCKGYNIYNIYNVYCTVQLHSDQYCFKLFNPLAAACRYIDHQHIFCKLHAIPTVNDVSFSPLGNQSWIPLPTPPQHEHLIYDEFVQPQPLKKAKTLKRGSNGGRYKKKS